MPSFQPRDIADQAPFFVSSPLLLNESNIQSTSAQQANETWLPILEHDCDFSPQVFVQVMTNLIRNPNLNSTHLFRADIWYDSHAGPQNREEGTLLNSESQNGTKEDRDHDQSSQKINTAPTDGVHSLDISSKNAKSPQIADEKENAPQESATRADYRPRNIHIPGYALQRTLVREMIPRNPQLDRPLLQTCHLFRSVQDNSGGDYLVVYLPHASDPEKVPWYHPAVKGLAYMYTTSRPSANTNTNNSSATSQGEEKSKATISIHYSLFPSQQLPLPDRLVRTAHQLLSTLAKHGRGTASGYVKRVHHDMLIPQARLQNTYSRLKLAHARRLIDNWVEQTDPSKHVFEDLGIAAFLIELWRDMYHCDPVAETDGTNNEQNTRTNGNGNKQCDKFPGFVDIGCGNGVLVDILIREGYKGWGFDARSRRSWDVFGEQTSQKLKEYVLVPGIINSNNVSVSDTSHSASYHSLSNQSSESTSHAPPPEEPSNQEDDSDDNDDDTVPFHNGIFPTGTFIISNHADELTPWTPLLGALSSSPFLIIPCCSHDLSGAKFRAPAVHALTAAAKQDTSSSSSFSSSTQPNENGNENEKQQQQQQQQHKKKQNKPATSQPSTYASLVGWVEHLATSVGYVVEKEMLRIPSTRNAALIGRTFRSSLRREPSDYGSNAGEGHAGEGHAERDVGKDTTAALRDILSPREILQREGGADGWVERAMALRKGKVRGH